MNAYELLEKIIEFGADEKDIRDRFDNNVALYEDCFRDFIDEPNFVKLRDAIDAQSYEQAFDAAHALKGLSGNLGLSAFYNAVRVLVESLRSKRYKSIEDEYAEVRRQHEKLTRLISDESQPPAPPVSERGSKILGV